MDEIERGFRTEMPCEPTPNAHHTSSLWEVEIYHSQRSHPDYYAVFLSFSKTSLNRGAESPDIVQAGPSLSDTAIPKPTTASTGQGHHHADTTPWGTYGQTFFKLHLARATNKQKKQISLILR